MWGRVAISLMLLWCGQAFTEECAGKFSDLDKTERLAAVKSLFARQSRVGLVNETQGSYVLLEQVDDQLLITFYTSGLFDLYAIKRSGPLLFCDTGHSLRLEGIERKEDLKVSRDRLEVGTGGPKLIFAPGPMPDHLRQLHGIDVRGIASDPR